MSAKSLLVALPYFLMIISLIAVFISAITDAIFIVQQHDAFAKLLHGNKYFYQMIGA